MATKNQASLTYQQSQAARAALTLSQKNVIDQTGIQAESTVRRWMKRDLAPHPVMLAVFWLTRWGVSSIDANAHNDAAMSAALARSAQRQVDTLERKIQRLAQIASFGAANDPADGVAVEFAPPQLGSSGEKHVVAPSVQPSSEPAYQQGFNRATVGDYEDNPAHDRQRVKHHEAAI